MGLVQAKIETAIETSPQLIESLHMARQVALKTKVSQVLPEHLQLAMLEDDESSFLLEAYGVDFKKIRAQLAKQAKKYSQPGTPGQQAVFSPQIETIMQHAREQAQKNALGEVDSNLVLAVMLSEEGGFLLKQLIPYDLDSSGVLQYLELREGKTVTITPLPALKNIIPALVPAPTPVPPTAKKEPAQAPSPLPPPTVAPATMPLPPTPPAAAATPAPAAKAPPSTTKPASTPAAAPMPSPALVPVATPTGTSTPSKTAPELAQIQSPPPAQPQQMPPQQTTPPAPPLPAPLAQQIPKRPKPAQSVPVSPVAAQAPLSAKDLTQPAAYGESTAPTAPPAPPPLHNTNAPQTKAPLPDSPSANEPSAQESAPSTKRTLFGRFGRKKKAKDSQSSQQGAQTEQTSLSPENEPNGTAAPTQTLPLPLATTPPPPAQQTPQPAPQTQTVPEAANNNPAPAPHTNLFASIAPTAQSVDTLLNRPPVPEQPQTIEALHTAAHLRNRPAKRRRASPDSLGANESLSATGSVLEKGRLVENIPRRMKVNLPCRAEVRITRAQMDEINNEFADLSSSHIHELAVTEAMTVQLRAPGGGFHIENLSPQTQWIDRNQRHIDDADFGAWKWNVIPTKSGKSRLQLVISARTVDDEGNIHIADIPDKIIELGIARDHRSLAKKAGIISLVGIAGLVLGKYGETVWQWLSQLTNLAG